MQENLNIGIRINSNQNASDNDTYEKYCYDDNSASCDIYGGLYQWREMMAYGSKDAGNPGITTGICPSGWHLPTDDEWKELEMHLGMSQADADAQWSRGTDEGGKLKDTTYVHWTSPNTGATNESGFKALPGGYRDTESIPFFSIGTAAYFWSTSEKNDDVYWNRKLSYNRSDISRSGSGNYTGYSVRCLVDTGQFSFLAVYDIDLNPVTDFKLRDDRLVDTLVIYNTSSGTSIDLSSISTGTSFFDISKTTATISPGDSLHLKISFNSPDYENIYLDTLLIECNDPYNPQLSLPLEGYIWTDSIIDIRNNNTYGIVHIGDQWWMQENLDIGIQINTSKLASNDSIIEKYCYDNDPGNCVTYGGLYQWEEMMDYQPADDGDPGNTQGICPVGWRVPTYPEWSHLITYAGGLPDAGGKLKETGLDHWQSPNAGATNETGFTALPGGGYISSKNYFSSIGQEAYFWTSQKGSYSTGFRLLSSDDKVMLSQGYSDYGYSLRCIRMSNQFSFLQCSDTSFKKISSLDFFEENDTRIITLTNSNTRESINVTSLSTKQPGFNLSHTSCIINPGDSIHISIIFTPPAKSIYSDSLIIQVEDPNIPLVKIPLRGTFPPEITFTDSTNISCYGLSDGTATVTPSLGTPPYQYLWDIPGSHTDSTATGLMANTYYRVTVSDNFDWSVTDSIMLSEPALLTSEITDSTNISCFGFADGTATFTPYGGTAPYIYSRDDLEGACDSILTGLEANQYYKVTTSDANGCTIKDSVMLSEPDLLVSSVTDSSNISCYGYSDGFAKLMVTGGTRPYEYLWDDTAETEDSLVTGISAGKYFHADITDANGCIIKDSVMLSQPDQLETEITDSTNISCYGGSDGTAAVTPSGGTEPYTYSWDDDASSTDSIVTGLSAETYYHASVSDANACPNVIDSVLLSQPTALTINMTDSSNISCYGLSDGTAKVTAGGGSPPYSYLWDDTESTETETVEGLAANQYYHVQVTDAHDCMITDSIILSQPDELLTNEIYSDTICLGSSNGYISTFPSGGTAPYNYLWSNDSTVQNVSNLAAGEYWIKVTDSHGCMDSINLTIHSAVPFEEEEICIVTIDQLHGHNVVVWEKTPNQGTVSYRIWRESDILGTVSYNDWSIFKDTVADPETRPYLYYISVLDTCGNESGLSPYHKPFFLQYGGTTDGVNLNWSEYLVEGGSIEFDSYSIYRGSDSTALSPLAEDIPTIVGEYKDNTPEALAEGYYYRIAGELITPCYPTGDAKSGTEPYHHALSNLDNNRLTSGIDGTPGTGQMSIFPNPMSTRATIRFHNPDRSEYRLTVRDLSGKLVYSQDNLTGENIELPRGNLSSGLYLVEIKGSTVYRSTVVIH